MNDAEKSSNRKKAGLVRDKRGFTLMEAVAGGAVAAIVCLIMASGFGTAISMIRKGNDLKIKGEAASSVIEGAALEDYGFIQSTSREGFLSYRIGTAQYEIPGIYKTAVDNAQEVSFIAFTADSE